jgi:uncharacterized protein (TIGR03790 family)
VWAVLSSRPGRILAFLFLIVFPFHTYAQSSSLAANVLVVYNSADAGSTDVANYYALERGIPSGNMCPINPPSKIILNWTDFNNTVKMPIKNCLNTTASGNIFYIVFTYNTPYKVIAPDKLTYSLDSFIADIWDWNTPPSQYGLPGTPQPYYAESQSQGNYYVPFLALKDYRGLIVYSVWRLDAANSTLAKGLVDKAMLAESSGLTGQVCIDEQLVTPTVDYGTGGGPDWDLRQAALLSALAGFPVLQDFNTAEFGTSPAPPRCDNAALYSGLYALNHYNDAFTWNPGAIGFHIESASAYDPRGGTNWAANALLKGITVTSGTMSEPLLGGLPHPDGIFRNLFEGANIGDAVMRNTRWLKWTTLNMGDPLYRPFPAGLPGALVPQDSLALTPRYLIGGKTSTGTINLANPAPAGGITVALKSSVTTAATVPVSVTIPAGSMTASFLINTNLVIGDTLPLITATFGTSTLKNTLVVQPLLASLALLPASVIGGGPSTGYLNLNSPAPAGGISVALASNNAAVSIPANVSIDAGFSGGSFPISTLAVSATTTATLSATYAGAKKTATLTVNPLNVLSVTLSPTSVTGGFSTTANKVTMSGVAPADTIVNLSSSDPGVTLPASVTVLAGTNVSPNFTITTSAVAAVTSVAISASYNALSKSASLTVNPISVSSLTLSPTSVAGGASTTTNKVTLSSAAPAGGAVVSLSSSDPGVTVPASVTVAAGQTVSPTFTITTSSVAATTFVTISATYNGLTKNATLTVNPIALLSLTLSPTSVVGGASTTLNKVTLNGPAPAGGIVVNLSSANSIATVPPSVTVAAGQTSSPNFTITTSAVAAATIVAITASYNGVNKPVNLTLNPVALLSLALWPTSVVGGSSTTLNKVNLSGPAPAGGIVVNLLSSDPGVTLPASITVAAGASSSPYFTITTSSVAATTIVTITASYNGVSKPVNLTVNPVSLLSVTLSPTSIGGGASTTANTVTLSGKAPAAAITVTLSSNNPAATVPPSVTVAAGQTVSPAFTITTSAVASATNVTISASYNGVTKTATLTVNPIALLSLTLSPTSVVGGASTTLNKVTLNGPAPAGGIVVNLSSANSIATVPPSVTVAAGQTSSPNFTITTSAVAAATIVAITASYNGVNKPVNLTLNPVALLSLALWPTSVVGGSSTTLNKVNLSGPAPAGGIVVNLSSSDPGVTLPASITVAAGASSSPYFTIKTTVVAAATSVVITATYNGVNKTGALTVNP